MGDCGVNKVRYTYFYNSSLIVVFYCLWIMLLLPSFSLSSTWKNYQQLPPSKYHPQSLVSSVSSSNTNQGISVCNMSECDCKPIYTNWFTIRCNFTDKQIVHFKPGSFPNETQVIEIIGGKEIELPSGLFYNVIDLQKIQFYHVLSLKLKKHSFANLTTVQLFLDIVECVQVLIESSTFDKIHGTLSGAIVNCNHVMIQTKAFSYLLKMNITNVPRLELFESAFYFDYPTARLGHHGPESVIHLENVKIGELPNRVFSTVLAEIQILNSQINVIRKNAFTANTIYKLAFVNTTIQTIENNAFQSGLFFQEFEINNTLIQKIESAAISSAINNITIHLSKIKEIEVNGINVTSSSVIISNSTFVYIGHHALTFKDCNYVNIEWNTFWVLANNSFNFVMIPPDNSYFHFVSNEIFNVTTSSLKFISTISQEYNDNERIDVDINYIKFPIQECGCNTEQWLQDIFGTTTSSIDEDEIIMYQEISYCLINRLLSSCYNVTQGLLNMKNFSDLICVNNTNKIECPKVKSVGAKSVIETINKELSTRLQHSDLNHQIHSNNNSYLYLILALSIVFLIIVFGAFVLLLVKGGLWLKRKGYCVQFSRFQYNSTNNHHLNDSGNETEDMINTTTQITPDQTMTENKLNENLPGELTHELLQALREKLNDPDSYHEAREMIERLYDHFLVEDPYNTEEIEPEGTHLYEELNARGNGGPLTPTRTATLPISDNNNPTTSDATPAYSFLRIMEERLNEPASNNSRTVLMMSEYAEPLDAELKPNIVEAHVYSELPITSVRIKEIETAKMALRPLPKKPNRYGEGTSAAASISSSSIQPGFRRH